MAGSLITRFEAQDDDSGAFGQVRYAVDGFGSEQFVVNETSGHFYVGPCGSKTCLDYELQDFYSLTCTAVDGGGKATSVAVTISVEDVNDNAPVFEKTQYRRHIHDRALDFEPPLVIKVIRVFFFFFHPHSAIPGIEVRQLNFFSNICDGFIKATDKDGIRQNLGNWIPGGRISYSIESGNTPDGLFSIDHDDGRIDLTRRINATELGETKFFLTVRSSC